MIPACSNCQYYHYEYYRREGKLIREDGFCKRTQARRRKEPTHACQYYFARERESDEALSFRRQQLCDEIEEWAVFLKKIKALGEVVAGIQELFLARPKD